MLFIAEGVIELVADALVNSSVRRTVARCRSTAASILATARKGRSQPI
jgi:hypothetical protein